MKPYDVGLICGRFQTYHIGHESLINMGMQLCDRILILIGSAQECGTERNPLNINTRTKMLKEIYGDSPNIMIYGLADMTDENDIRPEWGKYLLGNVDRYVYKVPELMITGNDEERNRWFADEDVVNMSQLIVNRGKIKISATKITTTLKEFRKAKGLTQENINHMTGLSQQMVSKIETGNCNPSLENFIDYCNGLGINLLQVLIDQI